MKNKRLTILLCSIMLLGITGCGQETKKMSEGLEDAYNKISIYFGDGNVDRSNLSSYSINEEQDIIIVALIDNSEEKQDAFIEQANVDSKYVKFEQGEPYTASEIDFYISKLETDDDIKFNAYYQTTDRTIYIAGNIEEFYILTGNQRDTLKNYISLTYQTTDDSIKTITEKLSKADLFRDDGTTVYKSNKKDITMIICNTTDANKDVYIGDYSMKFEESMCN